MRTRDLSIPVLGRRWHWALGGASLAVSIAAASESSESFGSGMSPGHTGNSRARLLGNSNASDRGSGKEVGDFLDKDAVAAAAAAASSESHQEGTASNKSAAIASNHSAVAEQH